MKWIDFPSLRQTFEYDCGAKAMHASLSFYGINTNEYDILRIARTTPRSGTSLQGMLAVAKHFQLIAEVKEISITELKKYIDRKMPIIVLLQAWPKKKVKDWKNHWGDGHYVVAIGYDKEKVYFEDPYSILRTYLTYQELEERWHDRVGTQWGNVRKEQKRSHVAIIVHGAKNKYSSTRAVHMD